MLTSGVISAAAVVVAQITFTNTISVGVLILSGLVGLSTVAGVVRGARWKSAYDSEVRAREGEQRLNETLEERIRTLAHERDDFKAQLAEAVQKLGTATDTIAAANATIARLEPLKDLGRVLEMITDTFAQLINRQEELHNENVRIARENQRELLDAISGRAA